MIHSFIHSLNFYCISYYMPGTDLGAGHTEWNNIKGLYSNRISLPTEGDGNNKSIRYLKENRVGASLVAQWLRIRLPMQGTLVRALVREDFTCRGATKPVRHNY